VWDSGFVGSQVRGFAVSRFPRAWGSAFPTEQLRLRQAARESVENLADARRQLRDRLNLLARRKLQPNREFKLRLAFGVRTERNHHITAITGAFESMPLRNIRWNRYRRASQLTCESE